MVAHSVAVKETAKKSKVKEHYATLKKTHATVQQFFTQAFPNTPVIYNMGNNDTLFHNQPTYQNDRADFYSFLYKLWFENHAPNRKWAAQAKATFMNGAYFRADINDKLSVLSINSLLVSDRLDVQDKIGNEAAQQFAWLENNLQDTRGGRKFILQEHMYAGGKLSHSTKKNVGNNWTKANSEKFINLWLKYKNNIVIELGGHDHW